MAAYSSSRSRLSDSLPWWEEEPARWFGEADVSNCITDRHDDVARVKPDHFDSPSQYLECVLRNNYNKGLNNYNSVSWVWRVINSAANNYRWKNGTAPRHRRYTVTFHRKNIFSSLLDYATGLPSTIETEWYEVVVGEKAQFYVEVKGEWGNLISPICVKALCTVSEDYCDSLCLSLSVSYVPILNNDDKSWLFGDLSGSYARSGILQHIVEYLTSSFSLGSCISTNKII